ncbi:uncharacterized protein METZ01_LOCUS132514, partial [marine metagenome]
VNRFQSIVAHHGEPGDPVLLEWIKHRLEELVGMDPLTVIVIVLAFILVIPIGIVTVYIWERHHSKH